MQFKRTNIEYSGRDKYGIAGNGTKFRKKSAIYGNMTHSAGVGGGFGPMPATGSTTGWTGPVVVDVDILTPISNIPATALTAVGYYVEVPINGFADNEDTQVWVGTFSGTSADNFGISGCITGLSVTQIIDNGTEEPKVKLKFTNELTQDSGELRIPVYVNHSTYMEAWSATSVNWSDMNVKQKVTPKVVTYSWNIKSAGGGTGYVLDLTNENTSVNCDSGGTIYQSSIEALACTAVMYYNATVFTGATFSISLSDTGATGVSINSSTGVLTFSNSFAFTGQTLAILVTATVDGTVEGQKTMTINKNFPSQNGDPAVSHWLVTSVNAVVVDVASACTPGSFTVTAMKQVGDNAPQVDNDVNIFWGYSPGQVNPTTKLIYNPATINTDDDVDYYVFALRQGNTTGGTIYAQQTVPLIREGSGPTIRGPIRWTSSLARRFSNGTGPQLSDREFIDVVRYGVHTYRCTTSYTQTSGSTWSSVSENWTLDDSYNFIASQVDLAQNEAIYIRPDNMIEFHNSQDGVVGRLTTSTMFYGASSYQNAPIKITNAGNIYGTNINSTNVTATGTIEGVTIKKNTGHQKNMIAMFAPYEMSINFVHDDADKDDFIQEIDGTWYVNGNAIVEAEVFQYLRLVDSDDEFHTDIVGNYILSNSSEPSEDEEYMLTGVVASDIVRQSNIIYITI